jgi:hypothetical protein
MRKIACFLVLAVAACSTTITSVDGNKKVNELSPPDDEKLCKDIAGYVTQSFSSADIARLACGFSSTDDGSCQADFDACVANLHVPPTPIADASDCTGFTASLEQCGATVSEFTSCVQEMVGALSDLQGKLPFCSQQAQEQALISIEGDFSADCIQLLTQCNLSFSSSSSSSSGGTPP